MRRWSTAAIAAAVGLSLLAGCGIGPGPVRTEGRAGPAGQFGTDSALDIDLSRPEGVDNAKELVQRFLDAAADDTVDRVKTTQTFLMPGESWLPVGDVALVRPLDPEPSTSSLPDGRTSVQLRVRPVGTLTNNGQIRPPSSAGEEVLRFTVAERPGHGLYLVSPPQGFYLNEKKLDIYFERRPLYFWDTAGRTLIPDLRYVSRFRTEEARADQLVKWIYAGPSPWLQDSVLVPSTESKPPTGKGVTRSDSGALVVDLETSVNPQEMERLTKQLVMTLVNAGAPPLELRVKGQQQSGPHRRPEETTPPVGNRYGIINGRASRLDVGQALPVRLPDEFNQNLVSVAFSRDESAAMLVHRDNEHVKLSIWQAQQTLIPVVLPVQPKAVSQPIWLTDKSTLLVLADNTLYQVGMDGKAVPVAGGQGLTAVSLSIDKTRLALVEDGVLKMAALVRQPNSLSISSNRVSVPTPFVDGVQNVTFLGAMELVVAGAIGSSANMVSMNVDGASEFPYKGTSFGAGARVVHLVAWQPTGPVYLEVAGRSAQEAQRNEYVQLQVEPTGASASPGAQRVPVYRPSFAG